MHDLVESGLLASFEQSPVAIAIIGKKNLQFEIANPMYGELVGRAPSELIGKPLLEALPEIKGQGFDHLLEQVIESGIPYLAKEVPVQIFKNGELETIYVDLTYQPKKGVDQVTDGVLVVATDVTQQVRTRLQVEESEKRFRSLVEEAPVGTCLYVGPHFRIEVANQKILSFWGKGEGVIGKTLIEALPELEGQPYIGILKQVYETGVSYAQKAGKAELVINGVKGIYYFDVSYTPLRDAQGQVYAILDVAFDVTEAVLARQRNQENEQFARTIFYNSPVAKLVFTGENMVLREANEKMIDLFGRGDSIIGKSILETVPELAESSLILNYDRVLKTGETLNQNGERIILHRQGQPYIGYYDYTCKALSTAAGKIYGAMCTVIEVTDKILSGKKLEESEAIMRGAVELAELGTWSFDPEQSLLVYSDRMKEWFGFDPEKEELSKLRASIDERDRQRVTEGIARAMDGSSDGIYDEVYTVIHPVTGKRRVLHAQGKTLRDDQGKSVRIIGTARDITIERELQQTLEKEVQLRTEELAASNEELRATNEELAVANGQLTSSNDQLAQYAYIASHDLQEPLRKIQTFSSMIQSHKEVPDRTREMIAKISHSAGRMSLLINDLLAFSRLLESGTSVVPVNLNDVLLSVINDFELTIVERNALVTADHLPVVNAVALQMNQLFYNLIGNALKFVEPGRTPHIEIHCSRMLPDEIKKWFPQSAASDEYYHISISDNGIGFEMQFSEHIFEVFKRLHTRNDFPGSGIGLSLCRRIVLNHKGVLFAESRVGEGSVFNIFLPAS